MTSSPRLLSQARSALAATSLGVGLVTLAAPAALADATTDPAPAPTGNAAQPGTQTYWTSELDGRGADCVCGRFTSGGPMQPVFPGEPQWVGTHEATSYFGARPVAQLTDAYAPARPGTLTPLTPVPAFNHLQFLSPSLRNHVGGPICTGGISPGTGVSNDWLSTAPEQANSLTPQADLRTLQYDYTGVVPDGEDSVVLHYTYALAVPAVATSENLPTYAWTWDFGLTTISRDLIKECLDGGSLVDQNVHGCEATALQNIIVYRPSLAADDAATTPQNTPVTVKATANDTIGVTAQGAITSNTAPLHGTAVYNNDGTYTYTPAPGFSGTDTFTYTITDDRDGHTTTATVTITVPAGATTPPTPAPSPTATASPTSPSPSGSPTGSPTPTTPAASPTPTAPGSTPSPANPAPSPSQSTTPAPGSSSSGSNGTGTTGSSGTGTAPSSAPGSYGVTGADTGAHAQAEARQRTWIGALAAAAAVVAAGAVAFIVRRRNG
ncbi:Ig-like domain-containing protein [Arthrobacter sp. UM1]|uniref:Ig-like domain-containing protein n=1 Tax=Arthrobacter sp. UM1 TaxID=2766776 RepID=UPI001CF68BC1|nr:Ig-like domain-containing protein [Arthrobacter sp. UM1]MCB4208721.1 Ig-like domain-containing protein [Arthrobacter sp. UM1]